MNNPLPTVVALLTLSPRALAPVDVARVVGLPEDECRRALVLMEEAGRAEQVEEGRYVAVASQEVLHEAVSAVRRQHRARIIEGLTHRLDGVLGQVAALSA